MSDPLTIPFVHHMLRTFVARDWEPDTAAQSATDKAQAWITQIQTSSDAHIHVQAEVQHVNTSMTYVQSEPTARPPATAPYFVYAITLLVRQHIAAPPQPAIRAQPLGSTRARAAEEG